MVRKPLLKLWRDARRSLQPVEAWTSIVENKEKANSYKSKRGMGGFVRSSWDEVNEIIAAANVYTKTWGRIVFWLFAHSCHVHGVLRCRLTLPVFDWRCVA